MEAAFYDVSRDGSFSIVSTRGAQDAKKRVRIKQPLLEGFLKEVPFVDEQMVELAGEEVEKLRRRGFLSDVTLDDILGELRARVMTEEEVRAMMEWWIGLSMSDGFDPSQRSKIIDRAVFSSPGAGTGHNDTMTSLSSIRYYVNHKANVPLDLPLPPSTLPTSLSKSLSLDRLPLAFGWSELSLVDWLEHIVSPSLSGQPHCNPETDVVINPVFSEKVFGALSRGWGGLSATSQAKIFEMLAEKRCMPTRAGMVKPGEAYFANVDLFPDLPIVSFSKGLAVKGQLEKLLIKLGVRRHVSTRCLIHAAVRSLIASFQVELQLVFSRLIGAGSWSMYDRRAYQFLVQKYCH